jgi:hypothetical protein
MFSRVGFAFALIGTLVTIAVGPGVTLVRCELTGEVMLECCCLDDSLKPQGSPALTAADDCCSFQRVEAPWRAQTLASQAQRHTQEHVVALRLPPADFALPLTGIGNNAQPRSRDRSAASEASVILRI